MSEQQFLETFKKKIIKETIKKLCKTHTIFNEHEEEVYEEELINIVLQPKIIKRCVGTTKGTPITQCNRYAIDDYDYCKIHLYKLCLHESKEDIALPDVTFSQYTNNNETDINVDRLQKVFIEDSFYYTDGKYIYDSYYSKSGYVSNNEFILTSDPFILEMI